MAVDAAVIEAFGDLFPEQDWVVAINDDAIYSETLGRLAEMAAPDLEVVMVGPGLTQRFGGVSGLRAAWQDWLAPFASYRIEPDPEPRCGEDAAVFFGHQVVVPKGSDQRIESEAATVVFLRDDQIARVEFHLDRDAALRAAGLA